ncbi:SufE family protein, partial [Arthrospira platensis SPKY1]|nr:SufE family protein [Arthrospira platensis SPKY1]
TISGLDDALKTEQNIVKGCQSKVWLHAELTEKGTVHFQADSDAAIVRGLIALLLRLYSDQSPDTILVTPPAFIHEIGMTQHLSMTRSNGLASMVKQMKIYAMAFKAKLAAQS